MSFDKDELRDDVRTRWVSRRQLDVLWEFLNSHRDIATAYNRSLQAKEYSKRRWREIAEVLNAQGDGAHKEWNEWSKYWVDFKAKLKKRVSAFRSAQSATGGGPSTEQPLSEMETKFLQILGEDFGQGLPGVRVEPFPENSRNAITMDDAVASEPFLMREPHILLPTQEAPLQEPQEQIFPQPETEATAHSPSLLGAHSSRSLVPTPPPAPAPAQAPRSPRLRRRRREQPMTQEAARRALVESSRRRAEATVNISHALENIDNTLQRLERYPEVTMPCNCEVDAKEAGSHSNGCHLNGRTSEPTNGHHPHRKTLDNDHGYLDPQTSEKAPQESVRYPDGTVRLRNPNIELMDQDILYHLALGSGSHDLVEMFGDVKFVCMGGTSKRIEQFAYTIMAEIGHKLPCGTTLQDISQFSCRYSMYKVGPVLCISHGMGIPSVGILLHEVIKLMYHAKVRDPVFFRIGTCGGIGYEGGSVVISEEAVDGALKNCLELTVLGKNIQRPAKLDKRLARELKGLGDPEDPYDTVTGKTMCTYDFYEGQGRLDGAFCDFTEADKMEYLEGIHKSGVVNIEMESLAFAALTHHAGIKAAVICVTFLDRLKGDQVLAPKEVLDEWQQRPTKLVCRYIKRYLQMKGRLSLDGHGSIAVKSPRRFKLVQQESETYD